MDKVRADKAYDIPGCRDYLRRLGIPARTARKRIDSSERLGLAEALEGVLPVHRYSGLETLLTSLEEVVAAPAEAKCAELRRRRTEVYGGA